MSQMSITARCKDCAEKDKDTPFSWGEEGDFGLVIEWMGKEEIIKKVKETHCPKCGGDNWYLTDSAEH